MRRCHFLVLAFSVCLVLTAFWVSVAFSAQTFNLSDLSTDPNQARVRLSKWKNSGLIELFPRDPAMMAYVSSRFWAPLSLEEKAGVIRDILYFGRFYNESYGTNYGCAILFSSQNRGQELGWGNLKPGNIYVFK